MTHHATDVEPLLSYVLASSNMRYIENNRREIYLRDDPQRGLVMRGEIPECGSDCHANLSLILLEFAMSCDDCRDRGMTVRHIEHLAVRLGERLTANLHDVLPASPDSDRLRELIDILLNSMGVSFEREVTADQLRYELANCPIRAEAQKTGLFLWLVEAYQAFVALCSCVVRNVAPEWVLEIPSNSDGDVPLESILISRA